MLILIKIKILSRLNYHKKNKTFFILFMIIALGTYLRLNDFNDLVRFNADQVRDAVITDKMFKNDEFPLLGPKAGGTSFKLGPAFYYLEYASGLMFGKNPAGIALFIPILSITSIFLLFLFLKNYFSQHISLIITLCYALSFYSIKYSRFAWNPNAIPFFLVSFLILLFKIINSKNKNTVWLHILLGIIMGISMQLHTTLLILMPTFYLLVYLYSYFQKKIYRFNAQPLFIIFGIIFLFMLPAIKYDLANKGSNIRSFIHGAQTKTKDNISLTENFFQTTQFFTQGSTYALSGIEPQKKWLGVKKILSSKNWIEISLMILGTIFFIIGGWLLILNFLNEKDVLKKNFLRINIFFIALAFLFFLPIANELNLRFFIILIFIPFIFLGLIIDFLKNKIRYFKLSITLILILLLLLSFFNLNSYIKTYNLNNYTVRTSAYGGISLGETIALSNFISTFSKKFPDYELNLQNFEFSQSVIYLNNQQKLNVKMFEKKCPTTKSLLFAMSKKENLMEDFHKKYPCFVLIDSKKNGRFVIYALKTEGIH